jgi:hypothetical protein
MRESISPDLDADLYLHTVQYLHTNENVHTDEYFHAYLYFHTDRDTLVHGDKDADENLHAYFHENVNFDLYSDKDVKPKRSGLFCVNRNGKRIRGGRVNRAYPGRDR